MKRIFLLFLLLVSINSIAQFKISQNCISDISTIISILKNNNGETTKELEDRFAINDIHSVPYLSLLVEVNESFDENYYEDNGIIVGARVLNIVSLKYPISLLDDFYALPGIVSLKVAGKIKPTLDKVLTDTRVDLVHAGYNLSEVYAGAGVIIGVTDWGFDYTSPMFYDTLLQETRILAAWDQFKTSGPAPEGMAYGTEFSSPEALFEVGSDTSNIYSYHTHATHVSGIAGGSGIGTEYRGIAFESEFLFTTFLVDEGSVLDAWSWMYDKSVEENKRLVINMSWGLYNMGATDGTSLLSQALDGFSDLGVVFVTSGGNNGNADFHIQNDFSSDTIFSRINFYSNNELETLWGQSIHGWGDAGNEYSVSLRIFDGNTYLTESQWYSTVTTDSYLDEYLVVGGDNDTIRYNISMDAAYPTNGRPQMRLRVKTPPSGYRIVLQATAPTGNVHFWNLTELTSDVGNWGMPFSTMGAGYLSGDDEYGIGTPACSESAITVAAHKSEYSFTEGGNLFGGNLASFSSEGPLIDGSLKPDISAPGVNVGSSISSFTDASYSAIEEVTFNDVEYPFARMSGTSMSSPAVAGIVALVLSANPYLTPQEVKQILINTAREDADTGELPDEGSTEWGWGKVTAYAAILEALDITGTKEVDEQLSWKIFPNPTNGQLKIEGIDEVNAQIEIVDMQGKICGEFIGANQIDVSELTEGVYWVRIINDFKVQQQKVIISR